MIDSTISGSPTKEQINSQHTTVSRTSSRNAKKGLDRSKELSNASYVSSEEKFSAMLGYLDLSKSISADGLIKYREETCGACGIIHTKPEFLHMYSSCKSCHNVLREPSELRKLYADVDQVVPLEILFATYGDPYDPDYCIDVTDYCSALVDSFSAKDRIAFRPDKPVHKIFNADPLPGKPKLLRMRYRADKIHGTLALDFNTNNTIGCSPLTFLMLIPKTRYVRIFNASYGHPKGLSITGRMSFDVLEYIQAMVDLRGGSYLNIPADLSLSKLFGDPCPGYPKDLRLSFEICGRAGSIKYGEIRGHLKKPLIIQSSPTVAPIIYVINATYGLTPTARRDRLEVISKHLRKIQAIEHRIREGMVVQADEIVLHKSKKFWLEQKNLFLTLPTVFIDVSVKMQTLADKGGIALVLDKETFDANLEFGNPSPGTPKILEVYLDCQGHDAERLTESNEMMDTGYSRNFITVKKGRFNIVVDDVTVEETGALKGELRENLEFRTELCTPTVIITRATYGELEAKDPTKIIDVTNDIQALVKGRSLVIDREINLNKYFRWDPSPGKRKQLKINYLTKGFTGNVRVREKQDFLVAGIELGYPPIPPPDDDDFVVN